jgi:hypothetical protein
MNRTTRNAVLIAFLLLAVGCSSTRSYDVLVTNKLSEPITVWMTKTDAPYGKGWYPPEEVAMETTGSTPSNGRVIAPGETGEAKATGTFDGDTEAILRIYRSVDLNTMLAMDQGAAGRLDLSIAVGKSDIDIVKSNDTIAAHPHGEVQSK